MLRDGVVRLWQRFQTVLLKWVRAHPQMKAPANVKGFSPAQNSVLSTFPLSNALPQTQAVIRHVAALTFTIYIYIYKSTDYIIFSRDARYKYLADASKQIIIVMAIKKP